MDKQTIDQWLARFSKAAIETIKEMAGQGDELNNDSLFRAISNHADIKAFAFKLANLGDDSGTSKKDQSAYNSLEIKLEKTLAQKETLLKQLDSFDDKLSQVESFYKRMTLQFIQMMQPADPDKGDSIQSAIDRVRSLLKKDARIESLESAYSELREATLRELPDDKTKKSGSFLGRLLKSDPAEKISQEKTLAALREAFQELVDELGLHFDENYLKKLHRIGRSIQKADNLDSFSSIRREVLALIQEYLSKLSHARIEAAAIFREIANRLMEVEKHLLGQLAYADQNYQSNETFNVLLENNINELKDSVKISKTMEDLKGALLSKIQSISLAIKDKRHNDASVKDQTDREVEQLKIHLAKMKQEIEREQARTKALEKEIVTDPLTGAYNRRAYDQRMMEEIQRAIRYKTIFSVLILDVDHFKKINDTYGHAIGDKCLQEIIQRTKPALRISDFLARFGGEEFVALLPETTGENAFRVAEKLRQVIENIDFIHKNEKVKITISIGVTQIHPNDTGPETIFERVDKALYRAKETGRNRVVVL